MSNNPSSITLSKAGLASKVSLLLSGSFVLSAVGTYLGQGVTSTAAFVVLLIAFLAGAFFVPISARKSPTAGIIALGIWTFISGLFFGPAIHQYAHMLGWQTVFLAYLGTGGIMAACGAVCSLSRVKASIGANYGNLSKFLFFALLPLSWSASSRSSFR